MRIRPVALLLAAFLLLAALPVYALEEEPTPTPWRSVSATDYPEATPAPDGAKTPKPDKTPRPTKTPKPDKTPKPSPTAHPEAPWFDNCALIGDSISDGLRIYATSKRHKDPNFLGNLQFFTVTSYSLTYASAKSPKKLVKYKGKSMRPEDALAAMGATKAFILLGANDIFHTTQENEEKYNKLINNIYAKNPTIKLGLIAMTPVVKAGEHSAFTNKNVDSYNIMLRALANAKGCQYIDFNAQLRDKEGGLKESYSRDGFVHLKGDAFEIYAAALEQTARYMSR